MRRSRRRRRRRTRRRGGAVLLLWLWCDSWVAVLKRACSPWFACVVVLHSLPMTRFGWSIGAY